MSLHELVDGFLGTGLCRFERVETDLLVAVPKAIRQIAEALGRAGRPRGYWIEASVEAGMSSDVWPEQAFKQASDWRTDFTRRQQLVTYRISQQWPESFVKESSWGFVTVPSESPDIRIAWVTHPNFGPGRKVLLTWNFSPPLRSSEWIYPKFSRLSLLRSRTIGRADRRSEWQKWVAGTVSDLRAGELAYWDLDEMLLPFGLSARKYETIFRDFLMMSRPGLVAQVRVERDFGVNQLSSTLAAAVDATGLPDPRFFEQLRPSAADWSQVPPRLFAARGGVPDLLDGAEFAVVRRVHPNLPSADLSGTDCHRVTTWKQIGLHPELGQVSDAMVLTAAPDSFAPAARS